MIRDTEMSYYFWTVIEGQLGTATFRGGQELLDFAPASLTSADKPTPLNKVRVLETEVDYTLLGRILSEAIGATELTGLYLDAIPAGAYLFPGELKMRPRFFPQIKCAIETFPAAEVLTADRVMRVNEILEDSDVMKSLAAETNAGTFSIKPIQLGSLPKAVEVVVVKERSYSYLGNIFRCETEPITIGLHERSVHAIEQLLTPTATSNAVDAQRLNTHKRVASERRRFRRTVRARLVEIICRLQTAAADPISFRAILEWLGSRPQDDATPHFVKHHIADLVGLYSTVDLPCLAEEFASIPNDLI